MKFPIRALPLLLFLFFVPFLLVALFRDPTELSSARIGQPLPTFALPDLLVDERTLTPADLPAGPLLLNVWATWCSTCAAEHEYLNYLAKQGVTIVGIVYKDNAKDARNWLEEKGNPYSLVLLDQSGRYGIELGVSGAPETYLLDNQHRIRFRRVSDVNADVWATTLEPLWRALQTEVQP